LGLAPGAFGGAERAAWPKSALRLDIGVERTTPDREWAAYSAIGSRPGHVWMQFHSLLQGFGCRPLLVFCDDTSEALAANFRPGGAGASLATGRVEQLPTAIAQLTVVTKATGPDAGTDVVVCADTPVPGTALST